MKKIIDVAIPTYKPDERLFRILEEMEKQSCPVRAVHLVNTGKEGLDALLGKKGMEEKDFLLRYPFLTLRHIRREEFDHGGTRNLLLSECSGADAVLFMTQDAVPAGKDLTEKLREGLFADKKTAAAYARQLPYPGAGTAERMTRAFNYPAESAMHSQEDFEKLGIKTYFCSNVCAMYRRDVLESLGGFPEHMIFNEDMVFAGRALQAGYRILYCADARVYHSHSYTAMQQFHRNFDLGVSQADHPEIFSGTKSEGEGVRYVKAVLKQMGQEGKRREAPAFVWGCAMRYLGYRLGKSYQKLPKSWILKFTSNKSYWAGKNSSPPGA